MRSPGLPDRDFFILRITFVEKGRDEGEVVLDATVFAPKEREAEYFFCGLSDIKSVGLQ